MDTPFPTLSYEEALKRFGTDKPDLRYEIELQDFKFFSNQSDFKAFKDSKTSVRKPSPSARSLSISYIPT